MDNNKSGPMQQPMFASNAVDQLNYKASPVQLTSDEVSCLAKGGKDAVLIAEKFVLKSARTSVSPNIASNVGYQSSKSAPQLKIPSASGDASMDAVTQLKKQRPQVSFTELKDVKKKKATSKKGAKKKK